MWLFTLNPAGRAFPIGNENEEDQFQPKYGRLQDTSDLVGETGQATLSSGALPKDETYLTG